MNASIRPIMNSFGGDDDYTTASITMMMKEKKNDNGKWSKSKIIIEAWSFKCRV